MSITITAYRADDGEAWRIERLNNVQSLLDHEVRRKIRALHDRKGTLSVDWNEVPTPSDLSAVIDAWKELNEVDTNHFVNGEEFTMDAWTNAPFGY